MVEEHSVLPETTFHTKLQSIQDLQKVISAELNPSAAHIKGR